MIGSLRFAKEEIDKLKRRQSVSDSFSIILTFDYSYENTVNLVGYKDFKLALDALGGEMTEDNIQQACDMSVQIGMPEGYEMKKKVGLSRASIITEPMYCVMKIR